MMTLAKHKLYTRSADMMTGDVGLEVSQNRIIFVVPSSKGKRLASFDEPTLLRNVQDHPNIQVKLFRSGETFQLESTAPATPTFGGSLSVGAQYSKKKVISLRDLPVGALSLCTEDSYWNEIPIIKFGKGPDITAIFFGKTQLCYCYEESFPTYKVIPLLAGSLIELEVC